ncbi:hypothetical protein Tco_1109637 [Tanacetum coccineum]
MLVGLVQLFKDQFLNGEYWVEFEDGYDDSSLARKNGSCLGTFCLVPHPSIDVPEKDLVSRRTKTVKVWVSSRSRNNGGSNDKDGYRTESFIYFVLLMTTTKEVRPRIRSQIPCILRVSQLHMIFPACNNQDISKAVLYRPPTVRSARSNSRSIGSGGRRKTPCGQSLFESLVMGLRRSRYGGSYWKILKKMINGLGSKAKKDWIKELISKHKSKDSGQFNGGIFAHWDTNFVKKDHHTLCDNLIAFYLESLITSWNGESLIMGDFNEVRSFPLISAVCLDCHLSDHRPILLKEVFSDFGPTPFRFYHFWLELPGFDDLVLKILEFF